MAKKKSNGKNTAHDADVVDELEKEIPNEQESEATAIDVEKEAVSESNLEQENVEPAAVNTENLSTLQTQSQKAIGFGSILVALLVGGLAAGGIGYFAGSN